MSTIDWKLDRPFAFLENELCYKGKFSTYHSLMVDSPQGVSTNGIRPGTGVSHSYFTAHYQPERVVSFDTTLGASEKTGDPDQSLNQMYGATWSEIAHSAS
jgi:hypothetical protein